VKTVTNNLTNILIGGTSNTGKSTLAQCVSLKLGFEYLSTDNLARHPGRPWNEKLELIPTHVREHYSLLTVDELISDVLNHYNNLWPKIDALLKSNDAQGNKLVLEGSALWPTKIKEHNLNGIWLTAGDDFLKDRIYSSSNYQQKTLEEQKLIDKFLARTLRYNEIMMKHIDDYKLAYINIENFSDVDKLANQCIEILFLEKGIKFKLA
jgi:2-phosphoglycerate kinase